MSAIPQLVRIVIQERVDVIYTIDRTVAAHLAQIVSRLTRRPLVLSAHYPFYGRDRAANRLVIRQAKKIHVHSDYLLAQLKMYTPHRERVEKIPNALQIERYNPSVPTDRVRQELGLTDGAPVIVLAGRLSPYKGQYDFVEAAARILELRPAVNFIIAGRDTCETMYTHGRLLPASRQSWNVLWPSMEPATGYDSSAIIQIYPDLWLQPM
jgi:glycosyltransferase involved in cell wall biosynthesis